MKAGRVDLEGLASCSQGQVREHTIVSRNTGDENEHAPLIVLRRVVLDNGRKQLPYEIDGATKINVNNEVECLKRHWLAISVNDLS